MIELIRKNHAAGEQFAQRGKRRLVRDISAREQQCALLAMEIGKLGFQIDMVMGVAADIAGSAGAGADIVQGGFHRAHDGGVLAHSEIVVRAPHHDRLRAVMAGETARIGEAALGPQNIDEHAISPFDVQRVDRGLENAVVVQLCPRSRGLYRRKHGIANANDSQKARANVSAPAQNVPANAARRPLEACR